MEISIIVTSDVHGYARANDEIDTNIQPYGLSRVSTYIKDKRAKNENIVLIDNGDFLEGSPFGTYLYVQKETWEEHPLVTVLNEMEYDMAVPGNHEFNYGTTFLNKCVATMNFPYVAANVIHKKTNEPLWKPYTIIEKEGIKIGVIGLVTDYIPRWENEGNIRDIQVIDPIACAHKWVDEVKGSVDILLLSYHGGIERDLDTGLPIEYQTGENVGYRLATEIPHIDGVITGHQHKTVSGYINGLPILQPGTRGSHVGELTFSLEKSEQDTWEIVQATSHLVSMSNIPEDEKYLSTLQPWLNASSNWLQKPIQDEVPSLVNFLHQIQQTMTNEAISGVSFFHAAEGSTDVTIQQVLKNFTFPCTFSVLRMTGKELGEALLTAAEHYELDAEGQLTPFAKGTKQDIYKRYEPMWQGLDYKIKHSENGIYKLTFLKDSVGQPINEGKTITIVCNHYKNLNAQTRIFGSHMIVNEVMIYIPDLLAKFINDGEVILPVQTHQYRTIK